MAFNPFTSFRKYQKFWMATILLLCMTTFVLCTGVGGDLSDRLLQMFGRGRGSSMAKIDGRSIGEEELHNLKEQRADADKVMKKACEFLLKRIEDKRKEAMKMPDDDQRKKYLTTAAAIQGDISTPLLSK